jgi:hypothetical protein
LISAPPKSGTLKKLQNIGGDEEDERKKEKV